MLDVIPDIDQGQSWDDICLQVGQYLGLEEAVPSAVLNRALNDRKFATNLIISRHNRYLLNILFNDARNAQFALADPTSMPEAHDAAPAHAGEYVTQRTNRELIAKATQSLLEWGKAGFQRVDDQTYNRRFGACLACPHLVEAPNKIVYKIKLKHATDERICNACGCVASQKAARVTEVCPRPDPANPAVNRWGQPLEEVP
jgi:hypothetical protein